VLTKVLRKVMGGSKNERELKKLLPLVDEINQIYADLYHLTDEQLRGKTDELRAAVAEATEELRVHVDEVRARRTELMDELGDVRKRARSEVIEGDIDELERELEDCREEEHDAVAALEIRQAEVLDDLLPRAYAVVKEACRRLVGQTWRVCGIDTTWDMVPFDVQLMGAIVLHQRSGNWRERWSKDIEKREKSPRGKIAEMATGEGKTLVATMPVYLNALLGRGVHVVTVNDYLAQRDREWMGKVYEFLGLTVGCIQAGMTPIERKREYECDVTHGTNNEFGFDYLRDNMAVRIEDQVQRGHYYVIVDEVDSVLIDEARTPLIISGVVEHSLHQFDKLKPVVDRVVHQQTVLVNRIVADAQELLDQGDEYGAGIKLLQARRGAPKNKRLMKIEGEVGVKKLISRVESEYTRDKRMGEIDEELFFSIDERGQVTDLSERGRNAIAPDDPEFFVLPDLAVEVEEIRRDESLTPQQRVEKEERLHRVFAEKSERLHNIRQLLKAYSLFEKDVEYVVTDGRVIIVDEFTGRLMPGRRFSDGLHEALEAKEGVTIERETQTMATITLQNYFKLYEKLAGMTGTAETEQAEFYENYGLEVVVIPTNEPVRRIDYADLVYKTRREKYNAVIDEIVSLHEQERPVLVGTVSVEVSETLSRMLKRRGIKHSVLNAKYHQKEAEIVALAGEPGAVTIATNMAGRGTDIKLGTGVVKGEACYLVSGDGACRYWDEEPGRCPGAVPCGLHIVGTERHEARRIDRQLRGRCGRQGDPGSSRFYLSLEDDLMRLFASEWVASVMNKLWVEEGQPIEHNMVTRAIERAQERIEGYNFDIRKRLLEYDNVMNKQRSTIYQLRQQVLEEADVRDRVDEVIATVVERVVEQHTDSRAYPETWDWQGLRNELMRLFLLSDFQVDDEKSERLRVDDLYETILHRARSLYSEREALLPSEDMRQLERAILLRTIDDRWRDHLRAIDAMREGIGLRAYGQKDPLLEYKSESFRMFEELLTEIYEDVIRYLFRFQVAAREPRRVAERKLDVAPPVRAMKPSTVAPMVAGEPAGRPEARPEPAGRAGAERPSPVRVGKKVGRNDPCPCGSGKKYKKCCGR